jgi:hypothetical protein
MAACGIAVDRRRVPILAAGRFDTVDIEARGDLARRLALDKLAEDPVPVGNLIRLVREAESRNASAS